MPNTTAPRFVLVHPDTGEDLQLPAKFEMCTRCEGHGSYVNPSVDGNGITAEEMAEDPDFAEAYFDGVYDVTCAICHGARVVPRPDLSRWSFAQKRLYVRHLHAEEESRRDYDSERWLRMAESGERW
jgi:hypothetical protein